jgi:hypothetical protein
VDVASLTRLHTSGLGLDPYQQEKSDWACQNTRVFHQQGTKKEKLSKLSLYLGVDPSGMSTRTYIPFR